MRILQVAKTSMPPGGQSHTTHYLSDTLARRGHQVTLLALAPRPRDRASLMATEPHAYRPDLVRLPRTRGLLHDFLFARAIRARAASGRFDLVHAQMLYPEGHCALTALRGLDMPLVVTGHGEDIQVDVSCGYGVRRDPRVDRRVRLVLGRAEALVAIGEAMRVEMLEAGAGASTVAVIRWGWRVAPEGPRDGPPGRRAGYLLSVGRLVRKKGCDLLLRALARAAVERPEARLIVAGEGPEREALEAMAGSLGVRERVEFAGFVTGGALAALYRGARAFVCPSRREPLGLVNLEAMGCGAPVVAFRVDGVPEIVHDGCCGLLAPPGDPDALAGALVRMLSDDPLRARLAARAPACAAEHDWDRVAERHERLYESVLARRRARRAA